MSARRKDLPPPDAAGTAPVDPLRARISLPPAVPPTGMGGPDTARTSGAGGYGRGMGQRQGPARGTRPDAEGMRRVSWYAQADAVEAIDQAVDSITARLGSGTPRHVALSALLIAAAAQADTVAGQLLADRADRLSAELARLNPPT